MTGCRDGFPTCHDLLAACERRDTPSLVDALSLIPRAVALSGGGVHADPNTRRESVVAAVFDEHALNGDGALHGRRGIGEGHKEPVAGVIVFLAPMAGGQSTKKRIVPLEQFGP